MVRKTGRFVRTIPRRTQTEVSCLSRSGQTARASSVIVQYRPAASTPLFILFICLVVTKTVKNGANGVGRGYNTRQEVRHDLSRTCPEQSILGVVQ